MPHTVGTGRSGTGRRVSGKPMLGADKSSRDREGQGGHPWEVKVCKWRRGRDLSIGQAFQNNPRAKALWRGHRWHVRGTARRLVKVKWGEMQETTTERPMGRSWGPWWDFEQRLQMLWIVVSENHSVVLRRGQKGARAKEGHVPDTILEATLGQWFSTLATHLNRPGSFTKLRPELQNTNWFGVQPGH